MDDNGHVRVAGRRANIRKQLGLAQQFDDLPGRNLAGFGVPGRVGRTTGDAGSHLGLRGGAYRGCVSC
jgi:hypothetical protein